MPESPQVPRFDIFLGVANSKDAIWLEAVEGIDAARHRMQRIAEETRGKYFVFGGSNRRVVATIDTSAEDPSCLDLLKRVRKAADATAFVVVLAELSSRLTQEWEQEQREKRGTKTLARSA
jgi:hypothetical protein